MAAQYGTSVMACNKPITAWRHILDGKIKFGSKKDRLSDPEFLSQHSKLEVPCRNCYGCAKRRADDWALRMELEAMLSSYPNYFITLTYDEENCPTYGHRYPDVQEFFMRYRAELRRYAKKHGIDPSEIKFLYCGVAEYGTRLFRPHYHINFFNLLIPDLKKAGFNEKGNPIFTSEILSRCWGKGIVEIQAFGKSTARYVAYHNMKKEGGLEKDQVARRHYAIREAKAAECELVTGKREYVDIETGELIPEQILPPKMFCSLKPAIGKKAFQRYREDFFPNDYMVSNGHQVAVPEAFLRWLSEEDFKMYLNVKEKRKEKKQERTDRQRMAAEMNLQAKLYRSGGINPTKVKGDKKRLSKTKSRETLNRAIG